MNIFALDANPYLAAHYQCDKHVVKMILESCQLLCSVYPPEFFKDIPYKRTHYNHPCAIWARTSKENFDWLCLHTYHLIQEYQKRYNKEHKCQKVLDWVWKCELTLSLFHYLPDNPFKWKQEGLTEFPQCMPDQYKIPNNPVQAYRNYYKGEKVKFAKWKMGNIPEWWLNEQK